MQGDRFIRNRRHHTVVNYFVGRVVEFLSLEKQEMKGSLDILSLHPVESGNPTSLERISYFLIHNGNDVLHEWNAKFA